MSNETFELCAYHESGRVVFAYQSGYSCDSIQLSETDSGKGDSKINASQDVDCIHIIVSGKFQAIPAGNLAKYIEVARNMMKICCAGSCAEEFFRNSGMVAGQAEIKIPEQDMKYIQLIQGFLKSHIPGHPDDYPYKTMMLIFEELKKPETWKAVDSVAKAALKNPEKPLSRFYIEDALMAARFEIKKQKQGEAFGIGISDKEIRKQGTETTITTAAPMNEEKQLDAALKDFLYKVKKEWSAEELQLSLRYLKEVFRKYNN